MARNDQAVTAPVDVLTVLRRVSRHVPNEDFVEFDDALHAVAELVEQQQRDAQLVAVLLSYLNDNLTEREKCRLETELMARDLSDHDQRRRAALARFGGA